MYTYTKMEFRWQLLLGLVAVLLAPRIAFAQDGPSGTAVLHAWPQAVQAAPPDTTFPFALLPFIERLTLDYAYGEAGGQPTMEFTLAWTPGDFGVLDGRRVSADDLPEDVRIERLTLRAGVIAAGRRQADVLIEADSLMLPPTPERLTLGAEALAWETLFTDLSADEARALFDQGFYLDNLEIEHIAFAVFEPLPEVEVARVEHRRPPPRVHVYPVDIHVHVGWFGDFSRRHTSARSKRDEERPVRARRPSTTTPERTITRGAGETGRTVTRNQGNGDEADGDGARTDRRSGRERGRSKRDKDDDDDDDDASLLPVAIGAAAAIGGLVIVGGTVGFYGNTKHAPFGLTAGYVQPHAGFLVQASVNEAVLGQTDEPEHFTAKVTSFYDFFGAPVQPALGLGVLATARDDIEWEPTVSLGLVGNFGEFVLFGGYDVGQGGAEFSVAYNFRARRRR